MAAIPAVCLPFNCAGTCFSCFRNGACFNSEQHCNFDCSGTCVPTALDISSTCASQYPGSTACQLACSKCTAPSANEIATSRFLSCDEMAGTAVCSRGMMGSMLSNTTIVLKDLNPDGLPVIVQTTATTSGSAEFVTITKASQGAASAQATAMSPVAVLLTTTKSAAVACSIRVLSVMFVCLLVL